MSCLLFCLDEGAHLDVATTNFWERNGQRFFDIQVFNPLAPSNHTLSLKQSYMIHEREKRRTHVKSVMEVECGSFSPLV